VLIPPFSRDIEHELCRSRNGWKRRLRALSVVVAIAGAVRIAAACKTGAPAPTFGGAFARRARRAIMCSCRPAGRVRLKARSAGVIGHKILTLKLEVGSESYFVATCR